MDKNTTWENLSPDLKDAIIKVVDAISDALEQIGEALSFVCAAVSDIAEEIQKIIAGDKKKRWRIVKKCKLYMRFDDKRLRLFRCRNSC